jgi:hypothetical protein
LVCVASNRLLTAAESLISREPERVSLGPPGGSPNGQRVSVREDWNTAVFPGRPEPLGDIHFTITTSLFLLE